MAATKRWYYRHPRNVQERRALATAEENLGKHITRRNHNSLPDDYDDYHAAQKGHSWKNYRSKQWKNKVDTKEFKDSSRYAEHMARREPNHCHGFKSYPKRLAWRWNADGLTLAPVREVWYKNEPWHDCPARYSWGFNWGYLWGMDYHAPTKVCKCVFPKKSRSENFDIYGNSVRNDGT